MKKVDIEHGWYTIDENDKYQSYSGQPAISLESYIEVGENDESWDVEGYEAWYSAGELHRADDLPAVIRNNGNKYWYTNGKMIRKEEM